jgi:hypothetical protein
MYFSWQVNEGDEMSKYEMHAYLLARDRDIVPIGASSPAVSHSKASSWAADVNKSAHCDAQRKIHKSEEC